MINLIKQFFKYVWTWISRRKARLLTKAVRKAVKSKSLKEKELKWEIVKMVRKYTKIDKDNVSKYIPLDEKTKAEVRFQVDLLYGEDMERLGVKLNDKLQLV